MKSVKALDITISVLKILVILAIAFSLCMLAFFSYRLAEAYVSDRENSGDPGYHSGTGLYYFASFILLFLCNIGIIVLNSIASLVPYFYKSCPKRRKNLKFFHWCYIAPVANQTFYIVLLLILGAIY
jgi:hypothetical protein